MNPSTHYELIGILGMGAITFLIRAVPFLGILPRWLLIRLESKQRIFPTMFLALLSLYCVAPAFAAPAKEAFPLLGCSALVALIHAWKRNLVLSLGLGTGIYLWVVNGGG